MIPSNSICLKYMDSFIYLYQIPADGTAGEWFFLGFGYARCLRAGERVGVSECSPALKQRAYPNPRKNPAGILLVIPSFSYTAVISGPGRYENFFSRFSCPHKGNKL